MKYVLQATGGISKDCFVTKQGNAHHELAMADVFESIEAIYTRRANFVRHDAWTIKELKVDDSCTLKRFVSGVSGLAPTAATAITGPPKTQAQLLQEKLLKNKEERIKAHREAYERQVKWEADVLETLKRLVEIHKTLKRTPTKKRSK